MTNGKLLVETTLDPAFIPLSGDEEKRRSPATILLAPMRRGDQVVGIVTAAPCAEGVLYTPSHLNRRQALADHVGGALHRIQTEIRLAESQALYQHIIETAREGICVANIAGRIIFVNPFLTETLGYTAEEMLGRPLTDFADIVNVPEFVASLSTAKSFTY
jgi:PAS domain-containing protein